MQAYDKDKLEEAKKKIQHIAEIREREKRIREKMKKIKYKIAIISGKGGVGKSTITSLLALSLASRGYKVCVFDSDFHGPTIPKMLGVELETVKISEDKELIPPEGPYGIRVMSIHYFLPDPTTAVIWRGPLKRSFLEELLDKTNFGDTEIILFDLPPGTGDEALNLAQVIPDLTGVIAVTQPTDVSAIAVAKALDFTRKLNIRVLGVIENMSFFTPPGEGKMYRVFSGSGGKMLSEMFNVPLLGQIPIDPIISEFCDRGLGVLVADQKTKVIEIFNSITDKLLEILGEKH